MLQRHPTSDRLLLRRLACALAALLAVAGGPAAVAQPIGSVLFVDADATGTADGSSWADAFPRLQQALAVAAAGDEVWVAEGVYRPAPTADRDASFVLVSGTALYGGFDGTETSADERDPEANLTVLSGDLGVPGDSTDNAFHVVIASGVAEGTLLDGFTVTGGYGNGAEPRNRGGGLYGENASLTVRDCRIVENAVVQTDGNGGGGGAFFGASGRVVFERVVFERNGLNGLGGGLWLYAEPEPRSPETPETPETAMRRQLQAELWNEAMADEGGTGDRGALSALLRGVSFVENTATSGGGASVWRATVEVVEARFERNFAFRGGGGLRAFLASADLVNVGFYGNVADPESELSGGGGMNASSSVITLTNVAFVGNTADFAGALGQGGGGTSVLTNVTFAANEAINEGGGVRLANGAETTVHNGVFWSNTIDQIDATSGFATLSHTLIEGGCPPEGDFGEVTCASLLDADPLFVRAPDPGADGVWGTPDDDYGDLRLQDDSPALDFGRADFLPPDRFDLDGDGDTAEPLPLDLAGEARVVGASVDLGAYERPAPVAAEPELTASGVALDVYPNPARGPVSVSLVLARPQQVEVTVFDVLGRRVARLHDGPLAAGHHALAFDASQLGAGLYLIRATGDAVSATQRVTVIH